MKLLQVQERIKKEDIGGFLFSSIPSVFYLSRFHSTNAYVLLTENRKLFITDSRYYEGAKEKLKDWEVVLIGKKNKKQIEELSEIINQLKIKKLGFEEDRTTVSFYRKLKEVVISELVGFSGFLNPFRASKTEEEINIIRKAVEKTDRVFAYILEKIPQAKDELDLRRMIINQIFLEGGEGESFPAIVASGKNSAVPHHETSHAKIEKNQPVLIDMGMVYEGYCSDFTRTVFYGKVDREFEKIYHIVKEAHLAAVEKVKAGVPVKEIDLAARKVIEKYGYGDYFLHSTGHGVGIEIHEPPRVSHLSEEVLLKNAVITIEPGIYIPGKYGVRLENIVVVREKGCEVLTQTSLQPVSIT
ncbi:aminopeptidase P family protein [Persephonella atlantica]|uniref:Aminopeptidase P family protein n=1 Tax=Persephonella atlantica TaxID=2699429 RepID=A0ABS1GFU7_9AQUI|nr:Xaa-Pro peptidase family protein [Persephonella atlantica]MBK3331647.1 aminopeptidase P family protein [Persephonella atlantica]